MKTRLKQLRQGVVIGLAVWGGLAGQVQAGEPVEVFSFGEARLQEPLPYQFHLPNHGEDVLEMRSATPSCDCIKIEEWTSLVEVGGTGSVQVIFTPDQAGEVDYRILVQTSDPQMPELEFAIRGTVTSPLPTRRDRDWSLYVSVKDTERLVQDPGCVTWVDVRSAAAFEENRIPGSIRIPLFAVKTKGFLRTRSIVLVDEGAGSESLEEEVRKMRKMGFAHVTIWYGGLHAWREIGGRLEGTGNSRINQLPPEALHHILGQTDWLVVGVGIDSSRLPEEAVALDFTAARKAEFSGRIKTLLADRPQVLSILLATSAGEMDPALAAVMPKLDLFAYELEGGWEAWERHRQLTDSIQPNQTGETRKSASASGVAIRGRGCGGCP